MGRFREGTGWQHPSTMTVAIEQPTQPCAPSCSGTSLVLRESVEFLERLLLAKMASFVQSTPKTMM